MKSLKYKNEKKERNPKAVFKTNKCHLGLFTVRGLLVRDYSAWQLLSRSPFMDSHSLLCPGLMITPSLSTPKTAVFHSLTHLRVSLILLISTQTISDSIQQTFIEHLICARHCAGSQNTDEDIWHFPWEAQALGWTLKTNVSHIIFILGFPRLPKKFKFLVAELLGKKSVYLVYSIGTKNLDFPPWEA